MPPDFTPGEMVIYLQLNRLAVVREQQPDPPCWVRIAYANLNLGLTCRWVAPEQLERQVKRDRG
jgi:hypothetical protein